MQEELKKKLCEKKFQQVIQQFQKSGKYFNIRKQLQATIESASEEQLQKCLQLSCFLLNKSQEGRQTIKFILAQIINLTSYKYAFILYRSHLPKHKIQNRIEYLSALSLFTPLLTSPIISDIYQIFLQIQQLNEQRTAEQRINVSQKELNQIQNESQLIINTIRGTFLFQIFKLSQKQLIVQNSQVLLHLSSHIFSQIKNDHNQMSAIKSVENFKKFKRGDFIQLFNSKKCIQIQQIIGQVFSIVPINFLTKLPAQFLDFVINYQIFSKEFLLHLIIQNISFTKSLSKKGILYFLQTINQSFLQKFIGKYTKKFTKGFCSLVSYMHNCSTEQRAQMLPILFQINWGHPLQLQFIYMKGMEEQISLRFFYIIQYRKLIIENSLVWKQIPILQFLHELNHTSRIDYVEYLRSLTYLWIIQAKKHNKFAQIKKCINYYSNLKKSFQKKILLNIDQNQRNQINIFFYNIQELIRVAQS